MDPTSTSRHEQDRVDRMAMLTPQSVAHITRRSRGHSVHSVASLPEAADTPATKITTSSLENVRSESRALVLAMKLHKTSDPFLSSSDASSPKDQRLSATASSFMPQRSAGRFPGNDSTQDAVVARVGGTTVTMATSLGTFSTDAGVSRSFKVIDPENGDVAGVLKQCVEGLALLGEPMKGNARSCFLGNALYVRLASVVDAIAVYNRIKQRFPALLVEYVSAVVFGQVVHPHFTGMCSAHEGQVTLEAKYPVGVAIDRAEFEESLRSLLAVEGELYAWQKILAAEAGTFRMVAEFVDADMAARAVQRCRRQALGNIGVLVELHQPDIRVGSGPSETTSSFTPQRQLKQEIQDSLNGIMNRLVLDGSRTTMTETGPSYHAGITTPQSMPYGTSAIRNGFATPLTTPHAPMPYVMGYGNMPLSMQLQQFGQPNFYSNDLMSRSSLTDYSPARSLGTVWSPLEGRDSVASAGHNRRGGKAYRDRDVAMISPQRQHWRGHSNGHNNSVDINRIENGLDVRTTIMLRNIPNKVDQGMLKGIVDQTSHGRYDFMYLRIDFSNHCNVGYAFINFVDPVDIINFVIARANQKWDQFQSSKVAEVSYATIQGRDCLIQKFRNSSVMLEPPHCRPKLYHTTNDAFGRAGEEEDFPPSDNASKLRRSCENAEHVGLFAPSSGQSYREEQRRRRSQYDRGTSLAEREEFGMSEFDIGHARNFPNNGHF